MDANEINPKTDAQKLSDNKIQSIITFILIFVVVTVLSLIGKFLVDHTNQRSQSYDHLVTHLQDIALSKQFDTVQKKPLKVDTIFQVNEKVNAALLAFSRAEDFNTIKMAAILLGFLLVFVGALYLLRVFDVHYKASADNNAIGKISLETSSPGLVMITLGVAIVMTAILKVNEINYSTSAPMVYQSMNADTPANKQGKNPQADNTWKAWPTNGAWVQTEFQTKKNLKLSPINPWEPMLKTPEGTLVVKPQDDHPVKKPGN